MPRPKVDRVMRSMRLPVEVDEKLVAKAERIGLSINQAVELAVRMWLAPMPAPKPRQVTPRFKKR